MRNLLIPVFAAVLFAAACGGGETAADSVVETPAVEQTATEPTTTSALVDEHSHDDEDGEHAHDGDGDAHDDDDDGHSHDVDEDGEQAHDDDDDGHTHDIDEDGEQAHDDDDDGDTHETETVATETEVVAPTATTATPAAPTATTAAPATEGDEPYGDGTKETHSFEGEKLISHIDDPEGCRANPHGCDNHGALPHTHIVDPYALDASGELVVNTDPNHTHWEFRLHLHIEGKVSSFNGVEKEIYYFYHNGKWGATPLLSGKTS